MKSRFAGRSNAGPASAVTLAESVSGPACQQNPRRTQHLNYFTLEEAEVFCRPAWLWFLPRRRKPSGPNGRGLIGPYLSKREQLAGPSGHHAIPAGGHLPLDIRMIDWSRLTGNRFTSCCRGRQADPSGADAGPAFGCKPKTLPGDAEPQAWSRKQRCLQPGKTGVEVGGSGAHAGWLGIGTAKPGKQKAPGAKGSGAKFPQRRQGARSGR